jgi:two-component system chemotaxis sensor kinase CheA
MENVLERLRGGQIELSNELVHLLLLCNDHLRELLVVGESDESAAMLDLPAGASLLSELKRYQQADAPAPTEGTASKAVGTQSHADIFRTGFDPLSFVTYLQRLGSIVRVQTVWRERPPLAVLDVTECFFGLELTLESVEDESRIRETFEFVEDESFISILPPHATLQEYRATAQKLNALYGESFEDQIKRWLAGGVLTPSEADAVRAEPQTATASEASSPTAHVASTASANATAGDIKKMAASAPDRRPLSRNEGQYVRIEASKLDRLINRVGELVIAASGTTILAQQRKDVEFLESVAVINSLVENIRDDALTLRMVPVGDIFSRFPRLVHETSQLLGKSIRLEIKGADTEIDKSMVEKLSDPLMHIVRNALDHGLETSAVRLATGKPETGTVTLNAYHDAGAVVVEIRDAGGGINRDKVLAKAIQRGLVAEDRAMSDQEILQLIFLPGFSTAEAVSDLSGRGVGMDVVKRNIEALRGVVEIQSKMGEGTVFRLRLPLTLAIIDGFRVEVNDATLVMPLDMMIECVDLPADAMQQRTRQVNVRDEWLPFVSLREMFGLPPATQNEYIVIVHFGENRAGIVVDRLLGEVQAVIKPLGEIFKSLHGISGSTILGNGRPALVLDIPQLIQHALRLERRQVRAATDPSFFEVPSR